MELKVGQKVVNFDQDNQYAQAGIITAVHGDGEYDMDFGIGGSVSPACHDGELQIMEPVSDLIYDYIVELEKHAEKTGYYKDEEAE